MSSTPVFSVVRVARSLVFCVMFCRSLFVLLLFFYWSLHCLSFFDLRLLVTPLVSCGHCIVCYSSDYGFWLPLWYLVDIVLSVILRITVSGYPFGIFKLLTIILSFLLRITASGYPFGILWTLCCLSFFGLRLLVTPLIYCGHCIVCYCSNYASGYPFGILWTMYCLLFFELRLLVTPLVSCGHCIVCYSSNYGSDYPFDILWTLYCLLFFELRLLVTPLVSSDFSYMDILCHLCVL